MALAITDDHRALAEVVRSFLADRKALALSRSLLESECEPLPPFWDEFAAQGWLRLHVPEAYGGEGFGLPELAVVLEETGRVVAPGPILPTVTASAVLAAVPDVDTDDEISPLLADLASGSLVGAVGVGGSLTRAADGTVSGDAEVVLGAGSADILLLAVGDDLGIFDAASTERYSCDVLDPTCRSAAVTVDAANPRAFLPGGRRLAAYHVRVLAAAQAAGIAVACREHAVDYVKAREQFGRPIGMFQAVKHHCADLLIDSELAVAAAWDAARAPAGEPEGELAAAVAGVRALAAAVRAAEAMIQLHGGIGFTWEHDAHLYLRRALTLAAWADQHGDAAREVTELVGAGVHRSAQLDLPEEAATYRAQVRRFKETALADGDRQAQRIVLVESGYLVAHWPAPFGRGANATEQLVIEQEFADVELPNLAITGWVIQTIAQLGTDEQANRWVRPTLLGEITWCQMFSEPGAGSDAAAVATRGVRVDGGWRVTGQKLWTTKAHEARWGLATVRTNSSGSKHAGLTIMGIDLHSPGVDIRPLRDITGGTEFNEVFLDDVFVPDADVIGEVGDGWRVARATLGNERVSIGRRGTGSVTFTARDLIPLGATDADRWATQIGELLAEDEARRLLLVRMAARAVRGADPGPEGTLAKLIGSEHIQRVTRLGMRIAGLPAVTGGKPSLTRNYLWARGQTIAGGTSEIARNQIAERLLGLPRDSLSR